MIKTSPFEFKKSASRFAETVRGISKLLGGFSLIRTTCLNTGAHALMPRVAGLRMADMSSFGTTAVVISYGRVSISIRLKMMLIGNV